VDIGSAVNRHGVRHVATCCDEHATPTPFITWTPTATASPTTSPPHPDQLADADGHRYPTTDPPPAPPINLRAAAGDREISLGWSANSEPDLAGYRVYSSTTGVEPFALQAAVTTTRYLNTGLTNGITYFYYVRAYDIGNNESPRSNITNAIPYDITSYTYPITATCSGVPTATTPLARQMALLLTSTARMSSYSTLEPGLASLTAQAMTWSFTNGPMREGFRWISLSWISRRWRHMVPGVCVGW